MNQGHMEYCASDDWRQLVHETILPVALTRRRTGRRRDRDRPGPGFTTDILRTKTAHLTAVELDEDLAASWRGGWRAATSTSWWATPRPWTSRPGGSPAPPPSTCSTTLRRPRRRTASFAELARVLGPGGTLVAADGVYSEGSALFHQDDTYNPIDPGDLEPRLAAAGFGSVVVRTYDLGWVCTARAA